MNLLGERVLVTGGAGFIASHIVEALLQAGARVAVLDDLSSGRAENLADVAEDLEFLRGSILDEDILDRAVHGARVVFNFAANADVPRSVAEPGLDFRTNAMGAFQVYTACRKHGVERVLQASTAAVYGEPVYTPMDEKHPLAPISPYGASKLAAESLGLAWHHTFGFPITVMRIFNIYGPRQPRYVIHDLFRKIMKDPNHLEVLGTGEQVRDYCFVTDAARAFVDIAARPELAGSVFNLAGGHPVSIKELVTRILACLELKDTEVTYTGKSWPGDITRLVADINRISGIGFLPTIDLETGLKRFAQWIST